MATNYKKLEIEIRNLVQNNREMIYDIASRCVLLLNESDSYAAAIGINPDSVVEHLNGYLRDIAVDLADCVLLLKVFPHREQWNKPLLDLLQEAEAKVKADRQIDADGELKPARKTIKRVEFDAVVKERDEAKAEARNSQNQLARLLDENEKLKGRIAFLEGRIAELERRSQMVMS